MCRLHDSWMIQCCQCYFFLKGKSPTQWTYWIYCTDLKTPTVLHEHCPHQNAFHLIIHSPGVFTPPVNNAVRGYFASGHGDRKRQTQTINTCDQFRKEIFAGRLPQCSHVRCMTSESFQHAILRFRIIKNRLPLFVSCFPLFWCTIVFPALLVTFSFDYDATALETILRNHIISQRVRGGPGRWYSSANHSSSATAWHCTTQRTPPCVKKLGSSGMPRMTVKLREEIGPLLWPHSMQWYLYQWTHKKRRNYFQLGCPGFPC